LNPGLFPENPARKLLAEHESAMRTNWRNDGRGFQDELKRTAEHYRRQGIAKLEKADPPTRLVGGGKFRKVIFLANPFLDFVGVWTAHHGRALFIEAKSHESGRLPINTSGGVSTTQWAALMAWRAAGAATAVLWRKAGEVRLWTPEMLLAEEALGHKSLVFEPGLLVRQGQGPLIWDFLPVLEAAIWGQK
jgi:hypothetical protein